MTNCLFFHLLHICRCVYLTIALDVYMTESFGYINEHQIYCIKRHKSDKIGSLCEHILYTTPHIRNLATCFSSVGC